MDDAVARGMRTAILTTAALVALVASLSCAPTTYVAAPDPPPPPVAPLDPFFDDLGPYGDWWWNDSYGWVWSPTVKRPSLVKKVKKR